MFDVLYFYAALIGGTVLVFQFALMLLGIADHDGSVGDGAHGAGFSGGDASHAGGDFHGDASGHGHAAGGHTTDDASGHHVGHWFYEKLSLRTISAAVTFFGLTGKTALARGIGDVPAFALACAAGLGALYGVYWLFKQVYKIEQAGNENVRLAVGLPATVYVPIPGAQAGVGKVMFRLQNRVVEYQAVTDDGERLATGEKVIVVGIVSSDTVRVARAEVAARA